MIGSEEDRRRACCPLFPASWCLGHEHSPSLDGCVLPLFMQGRGRRASWLRFRRTKTLHTNSKKLDYWNYQPTLHAPLLPAHSAVIKAAQCCHFSISKLESIAKVKEADRLLWSRTRFVHRLRLFLPCCAFGRGASVTSFSQPQINPRTGHLEGHLESHPLPCLHHTLTYRTAPPLAIPSPF